jgi:hypothetical protein
VWAIETRFSTLEEAVKMNRFLVALALLVVVVLGVGFYLGWFSFSTDSTNQKTNFNITVDKDKIREDAEKAKEKVHEAGLKMKERIRDGVEKKKDESAGP